MSFLPALVLPLLFASMSPPEDDSPAKVEADFRKVLQAATAGAPAIEELQSLVDRCLTLADESPDADTEFQSLEWALRIAHFRFGPDYKMHPDLAEVYREVLERMVTDFLDHPGIGGLVLSLEDSESEWLERIAAHTTNPAVQASLALREASRLMDQHRSGGLAKAQRARLDQLLAQLLAEDWAKLADPLGRGTIGDQARQARFELDHLSLGCVAPDIEGKDLDGVDFKLSDYRGKVVLLDFWGHW